MKLIALLAFKHVDPAGAPLRKGPFCKVGFIFTVPVPKLDQAMSIGLFLILCQLVQSFDSSSYDRSFEIPLSGVTVHWTIDADQIYLALRAETTGYIAFGLAEPTTGGMGGSDIVVGNVVDGIASLEDRYAMDKVTPTLDGCQDWMLVSGKV